MILRLLQVQPFDLLARLNRLLANELVLRSKTRNFRWNLSTEHHQDLDRILKDQGRQLDRIIEETVRIIRKQSDSVPGSLGEILLEADLIPDKSAHSLSPEEAVSELATSHDQIASLLLEDGMALPEPDESSLHLGNLFRRWSRLHAEMTGTLRAVAERRLHLF